MKLTRVENINGFLDTVEKCRGYVELSSKDGTKLNLKSNLCAYVALASLIKDEGSNLELYCSLREDENLFLEFFKEYPETI